MGKRTFAFGAATNQGKWPVQEDGFYVNPGSGLFAVADGFGGPGNGDLAAKLALRECRVPAAGIPPAPEGGGFSPVQAWQRELLSLINKKLLLWNEARAPGARGGCSLILATLERDRLLALTGSGACAALLARGGRWQTLLSPQSPPRESQEAALFPDEALGLGKEIHPETRRLPLEPGDMLFLFTSGFAWEREARQAELLGQLAMRPPGGDLGAVAAVAADGGPEGGEPVWNQTVVLVEAPV
jgi:serine/threonine protein phosphatase PrpC